MVESDSVRRLQGYMLSLADLGHYLARSNRARLNGYALQIEMTCVSESATPKMGVPCTLHSQNNGDEGLENYQIYPTRCLSSAFEARIRHEKLTFNVPVLISAPMAIYNEKGDASAQFLLSALPSFHSAVAT